MRKTITSVAGWAAILTGAGMLTGCLNMPHPPLTMRTVDSVEVVAQSTRRWTGVAVVPEGDVVVSYPRWSDDVPMSVARVVSGRQVPFPNPTWQDWTPGSPTENKWVCVQSVVTSPKGLLYVLDPASPKMGGVVAGGAKLVAFDPATNRHIRTYTFDSTVAPEKSYLNDVRFDYGDKHAIITDSGLGSFVVLDLQSGEARRVLDGHPSLKAEPTQVLVEGNAWKRNGETPMIHSDGIAIDNTRRVVYWQALTGRTLYSLPLLSLTDPKMTDADLAGKIKKVADVAPSDGLEVGSDGMLYLTAIEENAIRKLNPFSGTSTIVAQGGIFKWPDSLAWGTDHGLYVACSQIHLNDSPAKPFVVVRIPQSTLLNP